MNIQIQTTGLNTDASKHPKLQELIDDGTICLPPHKVGVFRVTKLFTSAGKADIYNCEIEIEFTNKCSVFGYKNDSNLIEAAQERSRSTRLHHKAR